MKDELKKIKFKYIFNQQYNPKYVNGAFGGIGPQGEIIINFYMERAALPNAQTFSLENDQVSEEIIEDREPEDHPHSFVRFVENGVVLDYKNAKEIHRWLGEHIKKLEKSFEDE